MQPTHKVSLKQSRIYGVLAIFISVVFIAGLKLAWDKCNETTAKSGAEMEREAQANVDAANANLNVAGTNLKAALQAAGNPIGNADSKDVYKLYTQQQQARKQVVVKGNWKWIREGEYDYARGSVWNGTKQTVTYWKVTMHYLDKKGHIVDSAYTNSLETLLPGAEKRFEIMHARLPEAKQASAEVEEVRFENE